MTMNPDKRNELEAKKACLQQLIKIRKYCETYLKPWLSIYDELAGAGIEFDVIYLGATLGLNPELLLQAVNE